MILDREDILEHGKAYKFRTQPVDPNDPMRGKYITLGFVDDFIEIQGDSSFLGAHEIFVIVEENDLGFAIIENIGLNEPSDDTDFVKAKISQVSYYEDTANIYIQYPFDRYYMEEFKAQQKKCTLSQHETLLPQHGRW